MEMIIINCYNRHVPPHYNVCSYLLLLCSPDRSQTEFHFIQLDFNIKLVLEKKK